ncbi:tRNA uridine-5-carboxymethylaminomethyl(34) synthesis GTPase MnmE [Hominifimenecus sp. rT4P-3]|uniref:tRNA uridine-5-carboxymethylaminomethyl(34) synthesis GTPase MnmE n=1 Tax=Hominifimenecus sp. rT4P-3 TaxID=3242979 RepID=UPI003DA6ACAE
MAADTIAAIASGLTYGGIGIIRISGDQAFLVGDAVVRLKGKTLSEAKSHTVHYGFVYEKDEPVDEILAVVMRGPHSFTGEDTVEIQCHGGPLVMKKILETVIGHGARLAEPGEFSKRAFLNGRLDLSQAEAVMELIEAQNEFARKASLEQLNGAVSQKIRKLREQILYQLAFIEAALDDPEHISTEGYREKLKEMLEPLKKEIQDLIEGAEKGKILSDGIRTVILGRPNAGKSSLLNLLTGEERAIVTEIEGTTRDTLEENIRIGGISLRLIDTAGIRNTEDQVEKIGVERAREQAEKADLLLYVVDSSKPLDQNDREILSLLKGRKAIILLNKSDLGSVLAVEEMESMAGYPAIPFSAKEGIGKEKLERSIVELFDAGSIGKNQQVTVTNVRHKEALMHAFDSLKLVEDSICQGMPEDFFSIDLMDAYRELGLILGEEVEDDLVNEIFSKFCMGK